MELFKIFGSIVIDDEKAIKTLKEADKEARNNTKSLNEVEKKLNGIGKAMVAAFSVAAITKFTKSAIESAAKLGEMDEQFDQVFRDSRSDALEKLTEQSIKLGWHTDRLKNSWNKFGGQFLAVGQDSQTAMNMTTRATEKAAEASAFYDVSLDSATESLQSLLKGNFTAGGAIGVYTNATEMGKIATEKLGLKWTELTQAQKQSLILEKVEETYKLNGAMGHAERESGNWANTTANLSARWERFLATIGSPVMEGVIKVLDSLNRSIEWVTENLNIVIPVVAALTAAFAAQFIISTVSKLMSAYEATTKTMTVAQWLLNAAMNASPLGWVATLIGVVIAAGVALYMNWDTIKEKAQALWTGIKNTFGKIGTFIGDTMSKASNTVKNAVDKIKGFFNFKWEFPKLKMPKFSISGSANPLNWLKQGVPKINVEWFAKGGIMTQPTMFDFDGTTARIGGEAGNEAILPLNEKNLSAIGRGIASTMPSNTNDPMVFISLLTQHLKQVKFTFDKDGFVRIIDDRLIEVL